MIFLVLIYVLLGVLVLLFLCEMWRQLYKLNTVNDLIRTYEHDVENPKLIDEMYAFCLKDRKLKKVMAKHNPTKEDFDKLYHKLLLWTNFRKYRRFVPISSFFAVYSLDYLLSHKDMDAYDLSKKMCNFFNI